VVIKRNYPLSPCAQTSLLLAAMLAMPALVGCGDDNGRVSLSGKVTYDGKPIEIGQIRFVPAPGTSASLTVERIKNGRYDSNTSGGVPVGSFQVAIRSYHPDDPVPMGPTAPPRRQLLPAKYNSQTELEVILKSGQKQLEYDFELLE
jgi:hypothetical protein